MKLAAAAVILFAACGDDGAARPDAAAPDAELDETTIVVDGLGELGGIAVDADAIYVIRGGTEVLRVGHDASTVAIVATAQKSPCCLHAAGGDLFWVNAGTHAQDFLDGSVMRLEAGSALAAVVVPDVYFPADVATNGDALYWVEIDGGALRRAGLDGSAPAQLYWSDTSKTSLAFDEAHVLWTAGGPTEDVVARDRLSGELTIVSGDEYSPTDLLALGDDVYWIEQGMLGSGLDRIRRSSSLGAPTDLALDEMQAADLVSDGVHVYWIAAGNGTVRRLAVAGGDAETVASGQGVLGGLAVLDGTLYWTDTTRGAIVRAAPR